MKILRRAGKVLSTVWSGTSKNTDRRHKGQLGEAGAAAGRCPSNSFPSPSRSHLTPYLLVIPVYPWVQQPSYYSRHTHAHAHTQRWDGLTLCQSATLSALSSWQQPVCVIGTVGQQYSIHNARRPRGSASDLRKLFRAKQSRLGIACKVDASKNHCLCHTILSRRSLQD